jgi:acyl dehydratase
VTTTMTLAELEQAEERDLGAGSWFEVTQERVNAFAEATEDRQWIHVDPERAAEGPFGTTISHGYLVLSLLPMMMSELVNVADAVMGVNYGIDRIRFTNPVPVGSRLRLHAKLLRTERRGIGLVYHIGVETEIEGAEKPAMVGEILFMAAGGTGA